MSENEPVDFKKLIKEEYKKCATMPEYFIRRYVYITHPVRGKVLFDMYNFQEDTLHSFIEYNNNIVLKARQIGLTTLVAAYSLWEMLFHNSREILVIATKQETAKTLISRVQYAFQNLPAWLQVNCTENNKLSLKFENGSGIRATTSSKDAGRSLSNYLLVIDEAAFIKNADDIWTASQASTSTGGRIIIISTPNGTGGFFHKRWTEATSGDNNFNPIKLDWRVHPERSQEWRTRQTEILGSERAAAQEYDAQFLGSGNTVIDEYIIDHYEKTHMADPIQKTGFDNNIWIWEHPDYFKTNSYIVCADVARGDGLDKSAFHVIEAETCTQVAEYRGAVDTKTFGHILMNVGTLYNDALIVVDNANAGWNTIQVLIDREYKNLFYMTKDLHYVDMDNEYLKKIYNNQKQAIPGFFISTRTRPLIISKLQQYFLEKTVIIKSERTLSELKTFIWNNGKPEAQEGYNDDLTMALAMGLWVRDTALRLYEESKEMTRASLDGINMSSLNIGPAHKYPLNTFAQSSNPMMLPIFTTTGGKDAEDNQLRDIRTWL